MSATHIQRHTKGWDMLGMAWQGSRMLEVRAEVRAYKLRLCLNKAGRRAAWPVFEQQKGQSFRNTFFSSVSGSQCGLEVRKIYPLSSRV